MASPPGDKPVSVITRALFALVLAEVFFIACQALLIHSTDGTGSWDGMGIAFGSLVLVPMLLITNCWVVLTRFRHKWKILLASLFIPGTTAILEYLWLNYKFGVRNLMQRLFVGRYWVWFFIFLNFLPLIITSVVRIVKYMKSRKIRPGERAVDN